MFGVSSDIRLVDEWFKLFLPRMKKREQSLYTFANLTTTFLTKTNVGKSENGTQIIPPESKL